MNPEHPSVGEIPDYKSREINLELDYVKESDHVPANSEELSWVTGNSWMFERTLKLPATTKESIGDNTDEAENRVQGVEMSAESMTPPEEVIKILKDYVFDIKSNKDMILEQGDPETTVINGVIHGVEEVIDWHEKVREEVNKRLKQLFEQPGMMGSSLIVTRLGDKRETVSEYTVFGFEIAPMGEILATIKDPKKEPKAKKQMITCFKSPDKCWAELRPLMLAKSPENT